MNRCSGLGRQDRGGKLGMVKPSARVLWLPPACHSARLAAEWTALMPSRHVPTRRIRERWPYEFELPTLSEIGSCGGYVRSTQLLGGGGRCRPGVHWP